MELDPRYARQTVLHVHSVYSVEKRRSRSHYGSGKASQRVQQQSCHLGCSSIFPTLRHAQLYLCTKCFSFVVRWWLAGYAGNLRLLLLQTAEAFSAVLRSNSTLREVDISSNALGVAGGRMLREAMAENMYARMLVLYLAASLKMYVASVICLHAYARSSSIVHACNALAAACHSFDVV